MAPAKWGGMRSEDSQVLMAMPARCEEGNGRRDCPLEEASPKIRALGMKFRNFRPRSFGIGGDGRDHLGSGEMGPQSCAFHTGFENF